MKHIRKLIAALTALALLLSFGMTALAANPSAGDIVYDPSAGDIVYVDTKTDAINSATGKAYRTDTGGVYDFLTVKEYNRNPCYCIEKGQVFTRTRYKGVSMLSSAYWKSLTKEIADESCAGRNSAHSSIRLSGTERGSTRSAFGARRVRGDAGYYLGVSARV